MTKLNYPFSQFPQENLVPNKDIRIYKRDFILSDEKNRIIHSIEIDFHRFKKECPNLELIDMEKLSDILLESIFHIDVVVKKIDEKSGKTTKLVDRWVQEFFEKGITYIYEGRDRDKSKTTNQEALNRFKRRMDSEHPEVDFDTLHGEFSGITCFKVIKK